MEEGTILTWLVADGGSVVHGEPLVEIETDKATMPYEAEASGVLQVVVAEGEVVAVGATIAWIAPEGAEPPARPSSTIAADDAPVDEAAPARIRVNASPVARRVASDLRIGLPHVSGTGPGGRIVKADVLAAASGVPDRHVASPSSGTPSPAVTPSSKGDTTVVDLSRVQQVVAQRMSESKATAPDFVLEVEIDMSDAVAMRARLNALVAHEGPGLSINDMVVAACGRALRDHPRANGEYHDGRLELHSRVNVGVAVALDDSLLVPTVTDADVRSLGAIAADVRRLVDRARAGTLTPSELSGGTFSVSNLGMLGIDRFTAVLNPPQAGILAVGAVRERIVASGGEPVVRSTMYAALTCDHRILYGADAARFLARVRQLLETPESLLL